MSVEIVDKVSSLVVTNEFVHLDPGEKVQMQVKAYDENGLPIVINPSAVKWAVEGSIGKMDAKGMFTAGKKNGSGKIIASIGDTKAEVGAKNGKTPVVVADFGNLKNVEARTIRSLAEIRQNQKDEPVKTGKISLRLDYNFENTELHFYPGISYRHCMVWENGPGGFKLTPPHDILVKKITSFMPEGEHSKILADMMRKSFDILDSHPVNFKRRERGLKPANSIWLWGDGKKPAIPNFYEKYKIEGSVISAVDLIKGIGLCAGLRIVDVEGATGNIHTNFKGKAAAALMELENGSDFVYVHIEAPDECGHRYEIENKVRSIELIDEEVLGVMLPELEKFGEYRIMILPDHPTPLSLRTHTAEPVPFVIFDSARKISGTPSYDEESAKNTGIYIDKGHTLMDRFLGYNI
jgi:2,3-diphosphopglycerate-independent phosphoglycerate mutase